MLYKQSKPNINTYKENKTMSNLAIMVPKYLINLNLPLSAKSFNTHYSFQSSLGLCSLTSDNTSFEVLAIPDLLSYLMTKNTAMIDYNNMVETKKLPWLIELTKENIDISVDHNKTIVIVVGTADLFLKAYKKCNFFMRKSLSFSYSEASDQSLKDTVILFYKHFTNIIANQVELLKESEQLAEYGASKNCSSIKVNLGYDLADYLNLVDDSPHEKPLSKLLPAHAKDIYSNQTDWYPEELITFVEWSKSLLERVPNEYLQSAKIEIQEDSVFINYERPETEEEAFERIATLKRELLKEKEIYTFYTSIIGV